MTKPDPNAGPPGHPIGSYGGVEHQHDAEDIVWPDYYYWVGGPPFLTDDPDPIELDEVRIPLTNFGAAWHIIRSDYTPPKKRMKASDVISLLHTSPGLRLIELAVEAKVSPTSLYAHLNRLIIGGGVIKKYNEDGERIYFAVGIPPPKPPKYSFCVHEHRIIICGHEQPKKARLNRLRSALAKFNWAVKQCEVNKTRTKWNNYRVTDVNIINCLENEPWSPLERLVSLYRPGDESIWAQHELEYASACMKNNLYRLRDLIIERDGLYNLKTDG